MKAVQINKYGSEDVLEINDVNEPVINPSQILVENYASSINPFDIALSKGYLKEKIPLNFPATLGGDFSGKIIKLGSEVTGFKEGDEVYGQAIILNGGSGAFAEIVAANAKNSALKPKDISFVEAASLPLVASSAVQALEDHIKLAPGQKILIHGGAGGIGHIAIQIAKSIGCFVATTVSFEDIDFVKSLGADAIIDYRVDQFEKKLKEFDSVFDTVGGEVTSKSFPVLKKNGILVSMAGTPDPALSQKYSVTGIAQSTKTSTEILDKVASLIDNGDIKVHIAEEFDIANIREAFKFKRENHPNGKVAVKIRI